MKSLVRRPASKQALIRGIRDLGANSSVGQEAKIKRKASELLQVVFVFDTTGSMYRYLQVVRSSLMELITKIKERVKQVEFAVVAYGDHCDANTTYVTKTCSFTVDVEVVRSFVSSVERTGGGDEPEALEDALMEANGLVWKDRAKKCIVLVGDAPPHGVMDGFDQCACGIDYREETKKLAEKGVKTYSVLCNQGRSAEQVFRWIADQTDGEFLKLDNMDDLVDLIAAVCVKESGGSVDDFIRDLGRLKQLTTSKERTLRMLASG